MTGLTRRHLEAGAPAPETSCDLGFSRRSAATPLRYGTTRMVGSRYHTVHLAQGSAFQIKVFREGRAIDIYGIERRER